jgi:hypothetical protein
MNSPLIENRPTDNLNNALYVFNKQLMVNNETVLSKLLKLPFACYKTFSENRPMDLFIYNVMCFKKHKNLYFFRKEGGLNF